MPTKKTINSPAVTLLVLSVLSMVAGFLILGFAPEPTVDEDGNKKSPTVQINLGFACIILSFFFLLFAFMTIMS